MERNDLKINEVRIEDNKTLGIISYLTWIGLLVAFIMNKDKNDSFVKFHIRQNAGLFLIGLASGLLNFIPGVGGVISYIVFTALFVLWVIGLIGAINWKENPVPVLGGVFQEWFKGI